MEGKTAGDGRSACECGECCVWGRAARGMGVKMAGDRTEGKGRRCGVCVWGGRDVRKKEPRVWRGLCVRGWGQGCHRSALPCSRRTETVSRPGVERCAKRTLGSERRIAATTAWPGVARCEQANEQTCFEAQRCVLLCCSLEGRGARQRSCTPAPHTPHTRPHTPHTRTCCFAALAALMARLSDAITRDASRTGPLPPPLPAAAAAPLPLPPSCPATFPPPPPTALSPAAPAGAWCCHDRWEQAHAARHWSLRLSRRDA
eukprot:351787-Chlamydomonas_euryale.AAC.2